MSGIELIAVERKRQIEVEGWTAGHDDKHTGEQLIAAAVTYAKYGSDPRFRAATPMGWPWESDWWKPSYRRVENLVKAGALIAAEIDRLQRAGPEGEAK